MVAAPALQLGTTADGEPFTVDLDALIGAHTCVAANSGGGKSGTIRKLLETSSGQLPHLILDPEDEFYTLRERFSYIIAGGDGGDAPATVANAPTLARMALENSLSVVAQINDLGDGGADFIAAFCDALIDAPRALWRPLLVVIDEAQRFAPAKGGSTAVSAIKNLLQRGRKRGYTAVVASTRISELDAGVRGLCRNWLLGFVGQSLDRRTASDQLGFPQGSAEAKGLQTLEPRQFWAMGPALSRNPVLVRIADVETTIVKSGQAKVPTPPAPEALREILAALAAPTIEPESQKPGIAESQKTGQPDERDARIAALEAEIADLRLELGELHHTDAECDRYQDGLEAIENLVRRVRAGTYQPEIQESGSAPAAQDADAEASPAAGSCVPPTAGGVDRTAATSLPEEPTAESAPARRGSPVPSPSPAGAPDRELRALAGLAAVFPAGLTEAAWATRTGYSRKGGAWIRRRKRYVDEQLIEQRDGRWFATAAGVERGAGELPTMPAPGPALVAWWADRLGAPGRLLKVLADVAPRQLTRDALAAEVNMSAKGGAFLRHVGELKAAELVTERGRRLAIAPELLR